RFRALDFEVVVRAVVRLDVEVYPRRGIHFVSEVAEDLLALVLRVRLSFPPLERADALRDELARENGNRAREVVAADGGRHALRWRCLRRPSRAGSLAASRNSARRGA